MNDVPKMDFRYLMQNQKNINKSALVKNDGKQMIEYDYKIVSFRIGNEYYGIDIMAVKEILKEKKFTRVPNALEFVVGVLNLRGDIMPVIDLAKMFHLKTSGASSDMESIIIVKVENLFIGLVVEQIQHVIPLRKDDIQPPSPLLGTINERYIKGVADINERLYVILDTDAVFSDKEKVKKETVPQDTDLSEEFFAFFIGQIEEFGGVHINQNNKPKFRAMYENYVRENKIVDMPKITRDIADGMIRNFHSKHTNEFWESPYCDLFRSEAGKYLQKICSDEVRVLEVGCGNGFETFSLYLLLSNMFEDANIKFTAVDINLGAVTSASGLEVSGNEIPSWINKDDVFMTTSFDRFKIKKEINDNIYFEFHDAKNLSTYNKKYDLIIARDMSLYLKEQEFNILIDEIAEKIPKGGVLVVGDNESVTSSKFDRSSGDKNSVYIKK